MVNELASRPTLKGWLPMALGVLSLVLGAIWTLQGLGILLGSRMSGEQLWAIIGPVTALTGLILVVIGVRVRSRSKN